MEVPKTHQSYFFFFVGESEKTGFAPAKNQIVIAPDTLSQATFLRYMYIYIYHFHDTWAGIAATSARLIPSAHVVPTSGLSMCQQKVLMNDEMGSWFRHIPAYPDVWGYIYIYYICVYILYLYIHIRKFVSMYQFSGRLATFWYCTVFNCYQGSLVWKTWSATKTTATCVIGEKVCETDATKTSTVVWFMIVFDIVCLLYERDGLMHLAPHVKGWVETESFCTQW